MEEPDSCNWIDVLNIQFALDCPDITDPNEEMWLRIRHKMRRLEKRGGDLTLPGWLSAKYKDFSFR